MKERMNEWISQLINIEFLFIGTIYGLCVLVCGWVGV